jgi:transcriptional regulator with XRE-family HTH domain
LILDIGTKIKMVRIAHNLTLDQLAEMCEVSKGFLSKIENNKVAPSVARLINIARAIKVNVSVLIDDDGTMEEEFIKKKDRDKYFISHTENGYDYVPFAPNIIPKQMHPFLFIAKKGEVMEHHLAHEGEEFIYILHGTLEFHIDNTIYIMEEGDSLYFQSLKKHGFMPISEKVVYLDVFSQDSKNIQ